MSRYDKFAIAAMICGITGGLPSCCFIFFFTFSLSDTALLGILALWLVGFTPGVLGLIFGIMGTKSKNKKGFAIAGIATGLFSMALYSIAIVFLVMALGGQPLPSL